jgi:hypothetical protein
LALAKIREHAEEVLRDGHLNHGIAEKLETLVIERVIFSFERNTGMSESLSEKQAIAEFVDNPLLERIHYRRFGGIDCHVAHEKVRSETEKVTTCCILEN